MINITPNVRVSLDDKSLLALSKKWSCSLLHFGQEENILGHSFERRPYLFVLKDARVFPISARKSIKKMVNTLLMVNITLLSYARGKKAWFVFPASREYFGIKFCQQIDKESTHW